jgi:hypothetical protein
MVAATIALVFYSHNAVIPYCHSASWQVQYVLYPLANSHCLVQYFSLSGLLRRFSG